METINITAADLKTLRDFAKDGIYDLAKSFCAALLTGNRQNILNVHKKIVDTLVQLPTARQDYAKRFVGALISEVAPKERYVGDYRAYMEKRVAKEITERDDSLELKTGYPYAVGAHGLTLDRLKAIHSDQVGAFAIGNKTYVKAWLGSSLLVVPQDVSATPPSNRTEWIRFAAPQ